jgi:hypothetical protein
MPPKVVSQATIEAAKRKANPGSRSPVYGAWERFKPTENRGYSWFPFDCINWLTSAVVNAMSPTAQGIYIRLLSVQWRDGYVAADAKSMAAQTGFDARTLVSWFNSWGDRLFVCLDHPNGGCDVFAPLRRVTESSRDPQKVSVSIGKPPEPSGCTGKLVNGKLHFLALKQGKLSLAADTEERRGNGEGEREDSTFLLSTNDKEIKFNEKDGNEEIDFFDIESDKRESIQEIHKGWVQSALSQTKCLECSKPPALCRCKNWCTVCDDETLLGLGALQHHIRSRHSTLVGASPSFNLEGDDVLA